MIPFQLHRRIPFIRRPFFQRDQALRERDAASAELLVARMDRDAANAELLAARVDKDAAKAEICSANIRIHTAEQEVETLKTGLSQVQNELWDAKAERDALAAEKDQLSADLTVTTLERDRSYQEHFRSISRERCGPLALRSPETHGDFRFVRPIDSSEVFCIINGRRRAVPHAGWWRDEGFPGIPHIETLPLHELLKIPPGPFCAPMALLIGKSIDEIASDPDLIRLYLGSLTFGNGIECGAGNRPLPISLEAAVRYVDAFGYGAEASRSFPYTRSFDDFMPIDVVDRIETLVQFADESLDFVIASHVIEHTPNPGAALVAAHRVLRPGGKLILIVPDKNGTFDRKREVTNVAHMVLDYEDYRRERDLAHYEEWYLQVARNKQNKAREDWENFVDIHYHCFTPASFLEFSSKIAIYAHWSASMFFVPQTSRNQPGIEFYAVFNK